MFLLFPNLTQKEVRHICGSWKEESSGKERDEESQVVGLFPQCNKRVEDGNELLRCWNMRFQSTERYGQKYYHEYYDVTTPAVRVDIPTHLAKPYRLDEEDKDEVDGITKIKYGKEKRIEQCASLKKGDE